MFQRLFQKLEEERGALGGKVFDILGKMTFDNKPLRELLIEAVRYGNDPAVRARLQQVVDNSLDQQKLRELLDERALTDDTMDVQKVSAIREEMERMNNNNCVNDKMLPTLYSDATIQRCNRTACIHGM